MAHMHHCGYFRGLARQRVTRQNSNVVPDPLDHCGLPLSCCLCCLHSLVGSLFLAEIAYVRRNCRRPEPRFGDRLQRVSIRGERGDRIVHERVAGLERRASLAPVRRADSLR